MHRRVRREFWGYAADEALAVEELIDEKYRGIRPAPGYPACPEHTEKGLLFALLDAPAQVGITLTESFAMLPTAAVSGFYFSHPQAQYFAVAKIDRDQIEDYARRKGVSVQEIERWLAPNLSYEPDAQARRVSRQGDFVLHCHRRRYPGGNMAAEKQRWANMRRSASTMLRGAGVTMPALAALLSLASGPLAAERLYRYTVRRRPELSTLNVRACFSGAAPATLAAESLDAPLALTEFRVEGSRKSIEPSGTISLKTVPEDGCVVYRVDISRPIRQHDRTGDKIHRLGRDLLTSVGIWFWRPGKTRRRRRHRNHFRPSRRHRRVPRPGKPVASGGDRVVFRTGRSPAEWPSSVAFGHFREREIRVGGARLRLAVLDGTPAADADQMQAWIQDSAKMVAGPVRPFSANPGADPGCPRARGNEPTPWAYVVRGGSPAAHFFVNQRRPIREFFDDWTAVHELSHLLLPYVNSDDIWLSEGVATYYQNVLRARGRRMRGGRRVAAPARGIRARHGKRARPHAGAGNREHVSGRHLHAGLLGRGRRCC